MVLEKIIHKVNPQQLFLIDALGAVLSALLLGLVLPLVETFIGVPSQVLYYLAAAALCFAVYSFSCYFLFPKNWSVFMRGIAVINLAYCCVTLGFVIFLHQQITLLGLLYFIGEIIIIVTLAILELKTAAHYQNQRSKK